MAWMQSVSKFLGGWSAIPVRNLSVMRVSQWVSAPPPLPVLCGRGDKKTKKGKRFKGTFGNSRPKKDKKIARIKEKTNPLWKEDLQSLAMAAF